MRDTSERAGFVFMLLAALWLAGCVSAPPATDAPATPGAVVAAASEQAPAEGAKRSRWERRDEVRCVDAKITGSHFQRRICLTEAQWDKLEEDGKQALRELQGPKTGAR